MSGDPFYAYGEGKIIFALTNEKYQTIYSTMFKNNFNLEIYASI